LILDSLNTEVSKYLKLENKEVHKTNDTSTPELDFQEVGK